MSLKDQATRLRAYCTAHGAKIVAIESDEGVSGKVPPSRRVGLSRALAMIRAGEADGLLVLELDRLSRTVRDVLDLVR